MKKFLALSLPDIVFIMLINGILTFMSRINFVLSKLSWAWKRFNNLWASYHIIVIANEKDCEK